MVLMDRRRSVRLCEGLLLLLLLGTPKLEIPLLVHAQACLVLTLCCGSLRKWPCMVAGAKVCEGLVRLPVMRVCACRHARVIGVASSWRHLVERVRLLQGRCRIAILLSVVRLVVLWMVLHERHVVRSRLLCCRDRAVGERRHTRERAHAPCACWRGRGGKLRRCEQC